MGVLAANVLVFDAAGTRVVLEAGTDVPEWAAEQLGAHVFENREHPFPGSRGVAVEEAHPGAVPRKAGPGASREAWAAYAEGKVTVPDGAGRGDIIALLESSGFPTE